MASDEDIDRLFLEGAERRLVEHARVALGHPARVATRQSIGGLAPDAPDTARAGATLVAELHVVPSRDVITGTMLTVRANLTNTGATIVRRALVRLAHADGATLRDDSTRLDGEPLHAAEAAAIDLGDLAPGMCRTVTWQLMVEPGIEPVYLHLDASADTAGIVGAPGVTVSRRRVTGSGPVQRPFYELEDHEETGESAPVADDAVVPVPAVATEPPPVPMTVAEAPPASVDLPPSRWTQVSRRELLLLRTLFAPSAEPVALGHHLLIDLLACAHTADGDPSSLGALFRREIEFLTRALVSARTGRALAAYSVGAGDLAELAMERLSSARPGVPPRADGVTLTASAGASDGDLRGVITSSGIPAALRLRQLALRLGAQRAVDGDARTNAALAAYNAAASAWVGRLVVRSTLDRRLDAMAPVAPALVLAAHTLVTCLTEIAP